ncbi:MAG: hypothetical protein CMP81_17310 [Fulvimarina sp.]|nr:hypothetical protein [Fulvimarina sp.]
MVTVSSAEDLAKALRTAPEGAVIGLDAPLYRITESLALTRRLTLIGRDPDAPPLLIFADGHCDLSVAAEGCGLENLAFTASGHRGTALLRIAADGCSLSALTLLRAQGAGISFERCHEVSAKGLVLQDLGQEAVVATDCRGLSLSLLARDIGRRVAAAAIRLVDCEGFDVDAEVVGVSGSAVTIEATQDRSSPMAGRIELRARGVQRALTVLGRRDAPASGLSGHIRARDWWEAALLLSNVESVSFHLAMPDVAKTPALKINGAFGLRDSTVVLSWPGAEASGVLPDGMMVGGGETSGGTVIRTENQAFDDGEAPPSPVTEALLGLVGEAAGPGFQFYEVSGTCSLCGWQGRFQRTHRSERETLACGGCRATLRYRGQAEVICREIAAGRFETLADLATSGALSILAIYEPGITGPLRPFLRQAGRYEQSIYDPDQPSGTRRADGIVHQDLMATAFCDASFDLVVTSDIFEHVRRPFLAFAEIRRILKPGGLHVWTVPIGMPPPDETRARVDTSGPEDRMILPPVYHGSGTDGLSLVYTDFGRDIGRLLAEMGLPTRAVRHVAGGDDHIAGVTFVSVREDSNTLVT